MREVLMVLTLLVFLFSNGLASPLPSGEKTREKQASKKALRKRQAPFVQYRQQLPRIQLFRYTYQLPVSQPAERELRKGNCKNRCQIRCTPDCEFTCCVAVPRLPLTPQSPPVYPENRCASYCPGRCYPRCLPSCCIRNQLPQPLMSRGLEPLERPRACSPFCSPRCYPQCSLECCRMSPAVAQSPSGSCPAPCSESCFPRCSRTCCRQGTLSASPPSGLTPSLPRGLLPLEGQLPCPQPCSSFCYPQCPPGCCLNHPPPPVQQTYLSQTPRVTYSQPVPLPRPLVSTYQQCPQPCQSTLCFPTCSENCCRAQLQPLQHPYHSYRSRIKGTCPAPCPPSCFPLCDQNCCAHHIHEPTPRIGLLPLEPPSCPSSCPSSCFPDCTHSCCSAGREYRPYSCPSSCPSSCQPKCEPSCCDRK